MSGYDTIGRCEVAKIKPAASNLGSNTSKRGDIYSSRSSMVSLQWLRTVAVS